MLSRRGTGQVQRSSVFSRRTAKPGTINGFAPNRKSSPSSSRLSTLDSQAYERGSISFGFRDIRDVDFLTISDGHMATLIGAFYFQRGIS